MGFFFPVLLKDNIMTLKFNPGNLPDFASNLADALNAKIGDFNNEVTALDDAQRVAYETLEKADSEFVAKFTALAEKMHAYVSAIPLEEDDDRDELFEAVHEQLNDVLWGFQHGAMTFEFQFDEDGVNLDWWESSSC